MNVVSSDNSIRIHWVYGICTAGAFQSVVEVLEIERLKLQCLANCGAQRRSYPRALKRVYVLTCRYNEFANVTDDSLSRTSMCCATNRLVEISHVVIGRY
jgi:hypothetical protein